MALDQANIGLKVTSHPDMDTRREESRSKFEIPADAQARRRQRIRFLRSGEEQHKRLGDKLVSCDTEPSAPFSRIDCGQEPRL
jgi:hypothetical protein